MSNVARWLEELGLGEFGEVFAENKVDFEVLPELTEPDLEKIGIPLGPRKKLLKAIAGLTHTARGHGQGADARVPKSYTPKHLTERILNNRAALEGERKQVTVLFADIKSSLALIENGEMERARELLDGAVRVMTDAVHQYEGTVNKLLGDGVMALFGAPLALEDHAVRACYAALGVQREMLAFATDVRRRYGVTIQARCGLHSGEVVVRSISNDLSMDYDAIGATVHLANRMEQLATPGTTCLSAATLRLAEGFVSVSPLGPMPVKGLEKPVEVYELLGTGVARSRLQVAAARGLTRFVGRDAEMAAIHEAQARVEEGHGQIVSVVGDPGVGKSRLFYEFVHSHRTAEWLVLENSSVSYGKARPWLPVIDLLRGYFRIEEGDDKRRVAEQVAGKLVMLGEALEPALSPLLALLEVPVEDPEWQALDAAQVRQRTLEAVKRLLLRESEEQPLILVFEDLHWIDGATQALLDALVESLPTCRVLLLVSYRPEYEHGWGGRSYYALHRIDPLGRDSAQTLAAALMGTDPSLDEPKDMLIARTEGNPLFLEESVLMLAETGALAGEWGAYRLTREVGTINIPVTVQMILAARIDRLTPEAKHVLQCAAAVGRSIQYSVLAAIAEVSEDELKRHLAELQAAEFLYEARLFPKLEYTFKHALTHEVAYGGLLQKQRRTLHAGIVDAIELLSGDGLVENTEMLAHHAFQGEKWDKAVNYLRQAGAKAIARSANMEATADFEKALVALQHLPDSRESIEQAIDLRLDFRTALVPLGEHFRIVAYLREAETLARKIDDRSRLGRIYSYITQNFWLTGKWERAIESGNRTLDAATAQDDDAIQVATRNYLGLAHYSQGDYRRAIDFFEKNVAFLQGDLIRERYGLSGLPSVLSRSWLAWCLAELGHFDEGIAYAKEGVRIAELVDQKFDRVMANLGIGVLYLHRGQFKDAVAVLRSCHELCRAANIPLLLPRVASSLGYACALSGRVSEALPLVEQAVDDSDSLNLSAMNGVFLAWQSEAYLTAGRIDDAMQPADLPNRSYAACPAFPAKCD